MKVKDIKAFLITIMEKEMEEEWRTTNHKEFITMCIKAKQWLLGKGQGMEQLTNYANIQYDIERYLKED